MKTPAASLRAAAIATLTLSTIALSAEVHDARAQSPLETVEGAGKGGLKNPYGGDAAAAEEGHRLYMAAGCHGGTGGG